MATQTIEFAAPSGQTISTVRLFAAGSDTIVDTAAATEYTNAKMVYYAQFTNLPAGLYRLVAINAAGTGLVTWWVRTLAATGTYPATETPDADAVTLARMTTLDSVLIASNSNQRTVSVSGGPTPHIAASIHNAEPDSIPAGALTDAAIAEIQSGLALQSTLLLVAGYTDTEIAAIKVVTDKLNTGLVADGAVFQFTANMLELAPAGGGGGGGGDATAANQQLILDQLDVIQAKTDLIGTSQALLAGAVLAPGTITSFPEILTIGDSYTVANGRAIQIPIIDSNGNPISEAGTLLFADADVSFIIKRASDTEASRILTCNASFVDPPGTGTGEGPYALIEIPAEETAKGLMKYQYSGILKFTWPGTADEVISFETGTITFDN